MPQIIFISSADAVESLEEDENPALAFPCMSSQQFHRDARAQLYALITGEFFQEAREMEALDRMFNTDGPVVYRLEDHLTQVIARLEEDDVEQLCLSWMQCEEIEVMDIEPDDCHEFMFQLIHFSQVATHDDLGVYIYSDD